MSKEIYCNPDVCDNCLYIGEGDSFCDEINEIVLDDWERTDFCMAEGCPSHERSKAKWKNQTKPPDAAGISE